LALTRPQKLVLAIGLLALLGGVFVISLRASGGAGGEPITLAVEQPAEPEEIVVHVVGEVNRPGVYRLRPGDRIADAVKAAGGFTSRANVESVNLAALLADGRQIVVAALAQPSPEQETPAQVIETTPTSSVDRSSSGQGSPAASPAAPKSDAQPQVAAPAHKISINRAGPEEFQQLPGIGEKMAKRIIYYRHEHGGFSSLEDLLNVKGIGADTFEQIKPYITL
jgi:competence protein ComEA